MRSNILLFFFLVPLRVEVSIWVLTSRIGALRLVDLLLRGCELQFLPAPVVQYNARWYGQAVGAAIRGDGGKRRRLLGPMG